MNRLQRICAVIVTSVILISPIQSYAATKTENISASKLETGKQLTLTGMPYNGKYSPVKKLGTAKLNFSTVQNFAYTPDNKYIFTVSECRTGKTKHTLLTRCAAPDSSSPDSSAEYIDSQVLKKYGHGEVLAITQDNLKKQTYNIWVAANPSTEGFGTNIERLTYSVKKSVGKITKRVIITNFAKANVKSGRAAFFDGKPAPRRVNVYADKAQNLITFRVQFPIGKGVDYVGYNFRKLNAKLNKVKNNGKYDISKAAGLQVMHLRTSLVPYNTFQSFTTVGKSLYVCGGHMKKGAQIYEIPFKVQKEGKATVQKKQAKSCVKRIINIETKLKVDGKVLNKNELEIEGMKTKLNGKTIEFYVNFFMKDTPIADNIGIYKFTMPK